MSDTTTERLTPSTGEAPSKGTFDVAANTLLFKGQIVCGDSAGRAAVPGAGLHALGISKATYNNRTGAPSGGAAGAVKAEIDYGVHGLAYTGSVPKPGQVVYVVDNQTVSLDPTGSRGVAGIVAESKTATGDDGLCYVFMGPLAIALAEALQGSVSIDVPLGSFRLSTGAAIAAFAARRRRTGSCWTRVPKASASGSTTTRPRSLRGRRFGCPNLCPPASTLTLHVLASRVGSADAASASADPHGVREPRRCRVRRWRSALTTGNFALLSGATKVVQELTKALDQNGGAQAGDVLSIGLVAAAGLDDDDAIIHAVWVSAR
jgi:hypothetical protein